MSKLSEAEHKIGEILRQLEIDTDSVVESIGCESINITKMGDDRRVDRMRVVIELQRQPGKVWA